MQHSTELCYEEIFTLCLILPTQRRFSHVVTLLDMITITYTNVFNYFGYWTLNKYYYYYVCIMHIKSY